MHPPAGCKAALWLLFLIGCSARPMNPPTDKLSHPLEEGTFGTTFWHKLLDYANQQHVATAGDAASIVPSPGSFGVGQPQQLGDGAIWRGYGQAQASSGYNRWDDGRSTTGLLDDLVASHAGPGLVGLQRHGSVVDNPLTAERGSDHKRLTADRSSGYRDDMTRHYSAPGFWEPRGRGQHGDPYAGQPTLRYQIQPGQPTVDGPAASSPIQTGYDQRPSSSARFRQPNVQRNYGYEQGFPNPQSESHGGSTPPHDPLQHGPDHLTLVQRADRLGRLLNDEFAETPDYAVKRTGPEDVLKASKEAQRQFGVLLQQKLKEKFPGETGEEVAALDRGGNNVNEVAYKRRTTLKKYRVEVSPGVYAYYRDGEPYVKRVDEEAGLNRSFWARQWLVSATPRRDPDSYKRDPKGPVQVCASAFRTRREGDAEDTAAGPVVYLGCYVVPRKAIKKEPSGKMSGQ